MTRDKAQKRAIRQRMAETGERYTTARHYHLDLHHETENSAAAIETDMPELSPPEPEGLPPRVADPGVSDAAVANATGKVWDEWLALLDAWGARARSHPEIARYVNEEFGVSGWWAQSIAVGYERARGMRALHQHSDGYTVSVSKTVAVPVATLYHAVVTAAERDRWLEPGALRLRTAQPDRSARFDVIANDTRLSVYFLAKDDAKSSVQIQHERLPGANDVEVWRAHWKAALERLAAILSVG